MRARFFGLLTLPFLMLGCGGSDDDTGAGTDYDAAQLKAFRSAIPSEERLGAPVPAAAASAYHRAETASLAKFSIEAAVAVNRPATQMVRLLKAIVKVPPTLFDSKKRQFLWGPWDNDNGAGKVAVYIQENEAGADFKYGYAFIRSIDGDLAKAKPVIWGAATPDPNDENKGVGLTLWDFEANYDFEANFDPDFDEAEARTRGRFVELYGHGEQTDGDFYFNLAVFRDFVAEDAAEGQAPADLDYFYGHFTSTDSKQLDFIDWQMQADLCDSSGDSCFENNVTADAAENFGLKAVFYERGVGRGEALLADGDLPTSVGVTECWNPLLARTFSEIKSDGVVLSQEGACQEPFDSTLEELGVPSLADVPADLLDPLTCVAEKGLEACK